MSAGRITFSPGRVPKFDALESRTQANARLLFRRAKFRALVKNNSIIVVFVDLELKSKLSEVPLSAATERAAPEHTRRKTFKVCSSSFLELVPLFGTSCPFISS